MGRRSSTTRYSTGCSGESSTSPRIPASSSHRGPAATPIVLRSHLDRRDGSATASRSGDGQRPASAGDDRHDQHATGPPAMPAAASQIELLRAKDFADCTADELAELAELVDQMRVLAPRGPSRWIPDWSSGRSIDLRRTLRAARWTGGDPLRRVRRRCGNVARPIVLLADVSGTMEPYSRIYLRVFQGAVMGARAHAYVFATRLTGVSRTLAAGRREAAVARALEHAPDTAGGTRIGEALKTFLDTDGRRGSPGGQSW